MFSATFLITFAADLADDQKQALTSDIAALGAALSDVYCIGEVIPAATQNAGDVLFEIGFPNQDAYEAAKQAGEWADLKGILADPAQVALYQFVAYGDGLFQLTDTERSRGHRVLLMNVRDGADPAMVEEAAQMSHRMQDFIDGFNNSKVAAVVESEGSNSWDYVFECDYEDPSVYSGAYLMHPIHITFIDRYFEPACEQWVFTPDLCTSVIEVDGPFLANYAD